MTKRYDEAIDVTPDPVDRAPIAFQWRGRRYEIDERLTSWREAGEWWNGSDRRDREYHRYGYHCHKADRNGDYHLE